MTQKTATLPDHMVRMQAELGDEAEIIRRFHQLYYFKYQQTWCNTHFLGFPLLKCPLDIWVYLDIITECKPDLIVESGTHQGGSALFFTLMGALANQKAEVLTIDIKPPQVTIKHPKLTFLTGSSTDQVIVDQVYEKAKNKKSVFVILDSDHSCKHVRKELQLYADLVTVNNYLIVEDTNINGHPILEGWGPGPMEALEAFLKTDDRFAIDKPREKYMLTFNPNGYLKRIK